MEIFELMGNHQIMHHTHTRFLFLFSPSVVVIVVVNKSLQIIRKDAANGGQEQKQRIGTHPNVMNLSFRFAATE